MEVARQELLGGLLAAALTVAISLTHIASRRHV